MRPKALHSQSKAIRSMLKSGCSIEIIKNSRYMTGIPLGIIYIPGSIPVVQNKRTHLRAVRSHDWITGVLLRCGVRTAINDILNLTPDITFYYSERA